MAQYDERICNCILPTHQNGEIGIRKVVWVVLDIGIVADLLIQRMQQPLSRYRNTGVRSDAPGGDRWTTVSSISRMVLP